MSKKMRDMPHDKKDNETDYFISNSEDIPILLQNMGAIKILFWVIFFMTGTIMRAFGPKYVWLFALIIIIAFIVYIYISFNTLKNIYKDRKKFLEAFYINNLNFIISFTFKIGSNSFIIGALAAVGGALTAAKATAVLAGLGIAIATAIELGTFGTGTLIAGAFLITWGGVIPTLVGFAVGYGINSLKGKTFSVNIPLISSRTIPI